MAESKKHGIRTIVQKRTDIHWVKPDNVRIAPGFNRRNFNTPDNMEHVHTLAKSIAASGVRQPLTGYYEDGGVVITDGECRLRATQLAIENGAKIESIPVKLEDRFSNEVDHLYSQELRNTGKKFTPAERAELFKALLDAGQTEQDIAHKCGLSREYVVNILKLRTAAPEIRDALEKGIVSGTLVMSVQKEGAGAEEKLRKTIEESRKTGATKVTRKNLKTTEDRMTLSNFRKLVKGFLDKGLPAKDGNLIFALEDVEELKSKL